MDFGLVSERSETGYYVGLLSSMMFVSRIVASPLWGIWADNWGRRPVVLSSLALLTVILVLFGLAYNFWYILIISLLIGASTPMSFLARTVMVEVWTPETLAHGLSILSLGFRLGIIAGAGIGGSLAHPEETWSSMEIFSPHPYLLPMIGATLVGLITFVLWFFTI